MTIHILASILLLLSANTMPMSPTDVVERQLRAYNAHDADAFAATYAADAQIYKAGSAGAVLGGRDAIRASYAKLFAARPGVRAEVSGRLVAGDFVSDHETIAGSNLRAIVVYEVHDGLIRRAWLFGPSSS